MSERNDQALESYLDWRAGDGTELHLELFREMTDEERLQLIQSISIVELLAEHAATATCLARGARLRMVDHMCTAQRSLADLHT